METKYPKFVVGAFIFNNKGELFLRTSPGQNNNYTCINGKVEWGKTIEETLKGNVKDKTNLSVVSYELIGLTDGLNITSADNAEAINMIFADYKVFVGDAENFTTDPTREYKWLLPSEWLKLDSNIFGPYIREIIEKFI